MNKIITRITALCFCLGLSFNALAEGNGAGKNFVFNLVGTGYMYNDYVPDIDGDGAEDPAMCFDVDLINAKNQQYIGTATDCLSDVAGDANGLALVGTTYFRMASGDLVIRGNTTVRPVLQDTVTADGQEMTHITGAAGTGNAVVHGTGRFAGAAGTARLSGMVNLSEFFGNEGEPIAFNCLFTVGLY